MPTRINSEISTGELRHRIEIVAPTGGQDSFGGVIEGPDGWMSVMKCWASIDGWSGDDSAVAGSYVAKTTHRIKIRWPRQLPTPITSQMAVWFRGRTFQINAVIDPDERRKALVLYVCEINSSTEQTATPNVGLS